MESQLFQEGSLHLQLDEMIFEQETNEEKGRIMQNRASLFENVEKAHEANLSIARDLKDLANMVREPEVFSKIAQAGYCMAKSFGWQGTHGCRRVQQNN